MQHNSTFLKINHRFATGLDSTGSCDSMIRIVNLLRELLMCLDDVGYVDFALYIQGWLANFPRKNEIKL